MEQVQSNGHVGRVSNTARVLIITILQCAFMWVKLITLQ